MYLRLTYLPLAVADGGTSPLVSGRARYALPRRGEDTTMWEMARSLPWSMALPGTWIDLDVTSFDYFADTGEVSWLANPLGLCFDEMELIYTAGFAQVPDPVKFACAQLVRNAQAMPALNVREGTLNAMHLEYFSDTLLDSTVHRHAGALRGAESGLKCLKPNPLGTDSRPASARGAVADALLRSWVASQITLRIADPSTGDTNSQLGLDASHMRKTCRFPRRWCGPSLRPPMAAAHSR